MINLSKLGNKLSSLSKGSEQEIWSEQFYFIKFYFELKQKFLIDPLFPSFSHYGSAI